ncbi:hypothetical protein GIB67_001044 [Kingdonia uniflora]|uniref:SAWADEE domain-containing protein n=1 Tax=Kingdonia uniflora TaxID=39325 RepID=A0A7J7MG09_9MAGN|nr:hypothetical protein GIB67_001044 [Kingdonia uniflora]
MASKNPKSPNPKSETSTLKVDYQHKDKAWYSIDLALQHETLVVKYVHFDEDFDDHFNPKDFKNLEELEEFKERFRSNALQMQDHQCKKVLEGMSVCASHVYIDDEIKFYDAVIDSRTYNSHKRSKGKEECRCSFTVLWQEGLHAGTKTVTTVEHICLPQPGDALQNQALAAFFKICREKLELRVPPGFEMNSGANISVSENGTRRDRTRSLTVENESTPPKSQETKSSMRLTSRQQTVKERNGKRNYQDVDLGGSPVATEHLRETPKCLFIMIENLDKDISPSHIVDFVYKHTSIICQVRIFPSLTTEIYARGILGVDSEGKLQKLFEFLDNPAHLILSSRGRPWVISEKKFWTGTVAATLGSWMTDLENLSRIKSVELVNKVRVVNRGTEEFKKGEKLKALFMEFANHQQGLQKRLALEEKKIIDSSI